MTYADGAGELTAKLLKLGQNLRSANQKAGIDSERPAEQGEHDERADPHAAAAHLHSLAILDIFAARQFINTHGQPRVPRRNASAPPSGKCPPSSHLVKLGRGG